MKAGHVIGASVIATALVLSGTTVGAEAKAKRKCVTVSASTLARLRLSSAGAVKATGKIGSPPRSATAWYVASPTGAAWATNTKPSADDFGGIVLPMNRAAREQSEVGVDLSTSAPIYGTLSATAPEIAKAKKCAAKAASTVPPTTSAALS